MRAGGPGARRSRAPRGSFSGRLGLPAGRSGRAGGAREPDTAPETARATLAASRQDCLNLTRMHGAPSTYRIARIVLTGDIKHRPQNTHTIAAHTSPCSSFHRPASRFRTAF